MLQQDGDNTCMIMPAQTLWSMQAVLLVQYNPMQAGATSMYKSSMHSLVLLLLHTPMEQV
jgi:hypothetical protein